MMADPRFEVHHGAASKSLKECEIVCDKMGGSKHSCWNGVLDAKKMTGKEQFDRL